MVKTCLICGKQFETVYPHKKYCCEKCARSGRSKSNYRWNKKQRDEERMGWARKEAEKLTNFVTTTHGNYVDDLADYIYNNYENKRRRRK